jgi:hypothetical protein
MIILHIYTAGSAVQLTQTHLATNIHSIEDLSGKAVVTWSNYVNMLAMHGVESEGHDWWVPQQSNLLQPADAVLPTAAAFVAHRPTNAAGTHASTKGG